jgi:hypothetical protein
MLFLAILHSMAPKRTRITRICPVDGKEFTTIPSIIAKGGGICCSNKCRGEMMRGEGNPHFGAIVSEETRKKLSEASIGRIPSEETRKIWSAQRTGEKNSNYGKPMSDEQKEKLRIAMTGKYDGEKNPRFGCTLTDETKKKISIGLKGKMAGEKNPIYGKPRSLETRLKISKTHKERGNSVGEKNSMFGKPSPHGKGEWFVLPNGEEVWLSCSYEPRVATALTNMGIVWEYESEAFLLEMDGKKANYWPDFYLPEYDMWLEVKGFWRDDAIIKVANFLEQYPNVHIRIVYYTNWAEDVSWQRILRVQHRNPIFLRLVPKVSSGGVDSSMMNICPNYKEIVQ